MALALNDEYRYRYEKEVDDESAVVARGLPKPPLKDAGLTEFVQVMPDEYKVTGDPVSAYRRFYVEEKSRFALTERRISIPLAPGRRRSSRRMS